MTAREKVVEAERQVRAMIDAGGVIQKFHCPFCGSESVIDQMLCCPEAGEIVAAVLDHLDHLDRCQTVEKAMDRFAAMGKAAGLN